MKLGAFLPLIYFFSVAYFLTCWQANVLGEKKKNMCAYLSLSVNGLPGRSFVDVLSIVCKTYLIDAARGNV